MRSALVGRMRSVAPGLYWRCRNGLALSRWCAMRLMGSRAPDGPYGEAFWDFHDSGDWTAFASLIVKHFAPASIVDIGCGDGKLLAALRAVAPAVRGVGYDSSPDALGLAARRGVEAHQADLAGWRSRSLAELGELVGGYDVAICLETAEHLPPWSAPGLVRALTRSPTVIFSAAQPLQGGTAHMNERPLTYWQARFASEAFELDPADQAFRDEVGRLDLPWWYGRNVQIFRRRG
jgi:SAM-dependent methyltransferase